MRPIEAYNEDLKRCPLYHDGTPRKAFAALDNIARLSWERDPRPRRIYPTCGTVYLLPDGWTWEKVDGHRRIYPSLKTFVPLALSHGLVAWGTPMPCNYVLFHHWQAQQDRERRAAIHDRLRDEINNSGEC